MSVNIASKDCRAVNHFGYQNDKTFAERGTYYAGDDARKEAEAFWSYAANGLARYLATGDIGHFNGVIAASRNCQKYRSLYRVCKGLTAHKWGTKALVGKIDAKKKGKLISKHADTGLENWEFQMRENVKRENAHQKARPKAAWEAEKRVKRLVGEALSNKFSLADLLKLVQAEVSNAEAAAMPEKSSK